MLFNIWLETWGFFLIKYSVLFRSTINSSISLIFQILICCLIIVFSFQKIGGLKELIVFSKLLFSLKFCLNFFNLFNLYKKVFNIKILSSLDEIFSFKIFKFFFYSYLNNCQLILMRYNFHLNWLILRYQEHQFLFYFYLK